MSLKKLSKTLTRLGSYVTVNPLKKVITGVAKSYVTQVPESKK